MFTTTNSIGIELGVSIWLLMARSMLGDLSLTALLKEFDFEPFPFVTLKTGLIKTSFEYRFQEAENPEARQLGNALAMLAGLDAAALLGPDWKSLVEKSSPKHAPRDFGFGLIATLTTPPCITDSQRANAQFDIPCLQEHHFFRAELGIDEGVRAVALGKRWFTK